MISRDLHGRRGGRAGMDGGSGSSRHIQDAEGFLRSALEKIVFFECRVSQLESELAATKAATERARAEAASARRRELELEQSLTAEKGQRNEVDRRAAEAEERVRLLEAERERLLGGLVDRARIAGAPGTGGEPAEEEGQADLAGFIAELRAEIEVLRAFKAAAVAAGFGGTAPAPPAPPPKSERNVQAASVSELGGKFDAAGRVGFTPGDAARMKELFGTRADRALYERSMADLEAQEAGKRLRAVHALEALGSRAAAPLLAAALGREREPEVKAALLGALARLKEPFAADLAERELGDRRPAVRVAALEALASAGPFRSTERLAGALSDESPLVRRRAALLLGFTAGERAEEALAIALGDSDRGVARTAASALAGRPSAGAQAALARGLEHRDATVRQAAATALGRLAGEHVDPDGTASARRASGRRIAEKLAAMDGEELRAAVLRSAEAAKATAQRVIAATARGSVAPPAAAPARVAVRGAIGAAMVPPHPDPLPPLARRERESRPSAKAANPIAAAATPIAVAASPTAAAAASATAAAPVSASVTSPARTARAAVAVVDAPAQPDGDLEPRIVSEIRAALRGCTPEGLAAVLATPAPRVEAALASLANRGAVERRGTRWFMS